MTMVIDLSDLILEVQVSLSDLPENYGTDEQIYFDLKTAYTYVMDILSSDVTDQNLVEQTIIRVGAYFTYMNYTSLAERKLGEVPVTMQTKVDALRRLAVMMVRRITNLKIKDDLTIDSDAEMKALPVGSVVLNTYLNY